MADDLPELMVTDAAAWRTRLEANPSSRGVWLVLAKKGTIEPTSLTYGEALDEALCFGWIDRQAGRRDESTHRQRFTPRRARSIWSKRNVGYIARLEAEGRMREAGRAEVEVEVEVERAISDGRWEAAYAGPATIEVPADLAAALASNSTATAMFQILTSQNRYAILFRLGNAKRAETRERRIAEFVAMLARGETLYPQKRALGGDGAG